MTLFNNVGVGRSAAAGSKKKGATKNKAPALAKAVISKPQPLVSRFAVLKSLPRTIRSRMIGAGKPAAKEAPKTAAGWALGPWLGSMASSAAATASAALASVGTAARARHAAQGAAGGDGESAPLYIDSEGKSHLGVTAGADRPLMMEVREMKVEEQLALARSAERRHPEHAATRRGTAAAMKRTPRRDRPTAPIMTRRKGTHQIVQPRKVN